MQVFLLDSQTGSRAQASGQEWVEDMQYSRQLDADWNLQAVRQVWRCSAQLIHELVPLMNMAEG